MDPTTRPLRRWSSVLRSPKPAVVALALCVALFAVAGCGATGTASTSVAASTTVPTVPTTLVPTSTGTTATSLPGTTGTATTSTTAPPYCSAAAMGVGLLTQFGLPEAVETMRESIHFEAMDCDYGDLEDLALAGEETFTFTFGSGEGGAAAYWRAAEAEGRPVLGTLVTILNMPYGRNGDIYVWPFAATLDFQALTSDQEDLLGQYFSSDDIREWRSFGGYLGYRVGITEAGDWLFFVAGD